MGAGWGQQREQAIADWNKGNVIYVRRSLTPCTRAVSACVPPVPPAPLPLCTSGVNITALLVAVALCPQALRPLPFLSLQDRRDGDFPNTLQKAELKVAPVRTIGGLCS